LGQFEKGELTMNHIRSSSKIYLLVIVLIMATGGVLVTAKGSHETQSANLEELARIKDDVLLVEARLTGPSRLEKLARIKDDIILVNARPIGPSQLEELARIKDDMIPVNARLIGPSRLEQLARIKEDFIP
jgi:hypothetical protein